MRVAVFSDVHGNLPALERFLGEVEGSVDGYLCLGDVVDYGPWNDECMERIRNLPNIQMLEGNHERLFLEVESIELEAPLVQAFFRHSRRYFSHPELMRGLPTMLDLCTFQCTHTIRNRRIYSHTSIQIDRDYMIGHSHYQFRVNHSGFAIVNPGSIGQNRDRIDHADYAILDTANCEIQLCSVEYDFGRFLAELRARGYPRRCIAYYEGKAQRQTARSVQ